MFVAIASRLLHENNLVDTCVLKFRQVISHIVRRSDTARPVACPSRRLDDLFGAIPAQFLEFLPQLSATRNRVVSHQSTKRVVEKLETLMAPANGFRAIVMNRKV